MAQSILQARHLDLVQPQQSPTATPTAPAPAPRATTHRLRWLLTGFGLLDWLRRHRARRFKVEEVTVYCVHRSFYLWAMILTGFVAAAAVRHGGNAVLWGWIYVAVTLYTLLTLLFDLSSVKFALWAGIFAFAWLASRYIEDLKHVPVLSHVTGHLRNLHPRLDAGTAAVLSWLLLGPWAFALVTAFTHGRKTFSPNSIEEYFLGDGREITDRAGLKFRSRFRDVLETLLGFGAGDLEAVDGNGHVVKRYENILALTFAWRRLDEILHQRSAVVDNAPEDPVEVEAIRK